MTAATAPRVRDEGNPAALALLAEVFGLRAHFEWRGLGFISQRALKACQCGEVHKGVIKPYECKVFGTACTPETPIGACMVSPEGACAAYYNLGRLRRETAALVGRPRAAAHG
jgi:hydrogenase expression/formation protein HypD